MKIYYNKNISWQDFNEFIYICNEKTKLEIRLDGMSRVIWLEIEKNNLIEDVKNNILSRFNVEPDELEVDLRLFFSELIQNEILREVL